MAKIMQYTDERGVSYPASYWKLVQLNATTLPEKRIYAEFHGFASSEIRHQTPVPKPVGIRQYVFTGEVFDNFFSEDVLAPEGVTPAKQAYLAATATKDVGGALEVRDADGNVITPAVPAISFFENATDEI